MKMYVPALGDSIKLTADWTFDLYQESRNKDLYLELFPAAKTGNYNSWYSNSAKSKVTIPAESVLKIDRIYIKKGLTDFNSITFWIVSAPDSFKISKKRRFWAKLNDVNNIEFDKI